jgi:hypothetical protein
MTDDGGFRQELGQRLVEACAPALEGITKARYWDVDREDRYDVDGFLAADAASCPARAAAILPTPFVHTPRTVFRAAGRAAFLEVLAGGMAPGRSSPAVSAHEGYRLARAAALAAGAGRVSFPWDWLGGRGGGNHANSTEKTASAAATIRFVACVARVWSPLDAQPVALRANASWTHPGPFPVRLTGRVDFVQGKMASRRIVLVRSGVRGPAQFPRVAFEALLDGLCFPVPRSVLLLLPEAGEREEIPVDEELLAVGVTVAASALGAVVARSKERTDDLPRLPGPSCRYCPALGTCGPGSVWLASAAIFGAVGEEPADL